MASAEFIAAVTGSVDALREAGLRVALSFDPQRDTAAVVIDTGPTPASVDQPLGDGPAPEPDEIGGSGP